MYVNQTCNFNQQNVKKFQNFILLQFLSQNTKPEKKQQPIKTLHLFKNRTTQEAMKKSKVVQTRDPLMFYWPRKQWDS